VRPANHPRTRLKQYAAWTRERPDWPAQLATSAARLPDVSASDATGVARRTHAFAALRKNFALLAGNAISGTRLDNLVCDGFLPLLAAQHARDFSGVWFHWWPGDLPPRLAKGLRELEIFSGHAQPACHGLAQGYLGWLLEHEARR
jgi:hypothetical protein